jgi:hypothetical protein
MRAYAVTDRGTAFRSIMRWSNAPTVNVARNERVAVRRKNMVAMATITGTITEGITEGTMEGTTTDIRTWSV